MCVGQIVGKYDIQDEAKDFFSYIQSDDWMSTADFGSDDEFNRKLSDALDPLA